MAESVDALVSNTSGATRAGSTPALGTQKRLTLLEYRPFSFCRVAKNDNTPISLGFYRSVEVYYTKKMFIRHFE